MADGGCAPGPVVIGQFIVRAAGRPVPAFRVRTDFAGITSTNDGTCADNTGFGNAGKAQLEKYAH